SAALGQVSTPLDQNPTEAGPNAKASSCGVSLEADLPIDVVTFHALTGPVELTEFFDRSLLVMLRSRGTRSPSRINPKLQNSRLRTQDSILYRCGLGLSSVSWRNGRRCG